MRLILGALLAFAIAAVVGLGATWWTVANGLPAAGLTIGPWRADPDAGTLGADPYERAGNAQRGEVPLAYGDGLAFTARADEAGRPLDASCDYELSGELPAARLWTLTAFNPAGTLLEPDLGGPSISSATAIRVQGAPLKITLARDAHPGNWERLPEGGAFVLRLSLYDTVLGTPLDRQDPSALLTIRRGACR